MHPDELDLSSRLATGLGMSHLVSVGLLGRGNNCRTQDLQVSVRHKLREGNQVADFLARQVEGGLSSKYFRLDELPKKARGFIRLDKLGLSYVRL